MRLIADPLAERRENARLPDAGLARDERDLALALARVAPAIHQQRDFMLAPDERRHALRPRRLEAADVLNLAQDRPGGNRHVEAFQRLRAKRLQLERAAEQPPCGVRNHNGARLGERLQSRRQIWRFADDRLFLRRTLADEIADHDNACGDADADLQSRPRPRVELREGGGDVEAGPDRAFGVFLMGARKAEIRQHAVAHEFGDEAVIARDRARTGILIGANDLAHVLGIEPGRECGGAYEVAEHDRELAPLGRVRRRGARDRSGSGWRRRRGTSERCDGLQQALAVS